jgi:hypothetical protein
MFESDPRKQQFKQSKDSVFGGLKLTESLFNKVEDFKAKVIDLEHEVESKEQNNRILKR